MSKEFWDASFEEQAARQAYNTAPVEAIVRNVSYYLRDRFHADALATLRFLEIGCGAGPNLVWLARKGIKVSGVDISSNALRLSRETLDQAGLGGQVEKLVESSASDLPFADEQFDGIIEACVFQHLAKKERDAAFAGVKRLLKPGGIFAGYMLSRDHTVYIEKHSDQEPDDPGTLKLAEGDSKIYLTNLGVCHFYDREEILQYLDGFSLVDPCATTYAIPRQEAAKRGYAEYVQGMWAVYAIK